MKFIFSVLIITGFNCDLLSDNIIDEKVNYITVTNFKKALSVNRLTEPWEIQRYKGIPCFNIEISDSIPAVHIRSCGETAFGFRRNISVNLKSFPYISWRWKAVILPDGGDIRKSNRDDQVLQIYLVFNKATGHTFSKPETIAYVWDNEAPAEGIFPSPHIMLENVRYIILRNKFDLRGVMLYERRDVPRDYIKAFGNRYSSDSLNVTSIILYTNTHHTHNSAEGYFGDIFFSR